MDIFSALDVNVQDADLASGLDVKHLALAGAVEVAMHFIVLEEVGLLDLLLEVHPLHEVVVHAVLFALSWLSRRA